MLRAKAKELLLKMFDQSQEARLTLARLKKNKEEAGRSKMIRKFIKDQLTSGKTLVYAYRHMKYNGTWIRTKPEQAE